MKDPRAGLAHYYDLNTTFPNDVPFYLERVASPKTTVLELGCGTGRVSVPLARHSARFVGVDHSAEMAGTCERRLAEADLSSKARVVVGDITDLSLADRFSLIVAPFRVLQNLEGDAEVSALFRTVRAHLAPQGRCILNAFCPNQSRAELIGLWKEPSETVAWEADTPRGRVVRLDRRAGVRESPLVLYPDLVYRRYDGDELVEEIVHSIAMRCYYPQELLDQITAEDFTVTRSWGGYGGEEYGEGPELVVEFGMDA